MDNLLVGASERHWHGYLDMRFVVPSCNVKVAQPAEKRLEAWQRFCLGWDLHLTPDLLKMILPGPAPMTPYTYKPRWNP